ncbi:MAG: biotin--[acetyl-CoA-carboxylase] ligase [Ruminococcus sp.]|jgi:BirA family biotin operon repressor/biotin-[acetyl-CoA-carboxylase] ligase|nr:biotin--[acetyl-CoA-carboxylase] ligase [Ruminococcus sp.]
MKLKEKVLESLMENGDKYVTGTAIAKECGVSRNAVWKVMKQLEEEGYQIEASKKSGYRVVKHNVLSKQLIESYLETQVYGRELVVLESVDSTNNYAKTLAQNGAADGTAVASDCQTAGKGRMGRTFCSPKGIGLYVSLIIKPVSDMHDAQLLTACAAVSAAEAVENVSGAQVQIKWVNDLFMGGRKICGILTEASVSFETKQLDYAIIGIGINVGTTESFPDELKAIATSIEDETGKFVERNKLCAELMKTLEKNVEQLGNGGFMEEYRRRSFIIGKKVKITRNGQETIGKAVKINDDASLQVETEDGLQLTVNSGEASICK